MTLSHPKIKFLVDTACVDSGTVFDALKERYPLIPYCGFYELQKDVWLYVQHKQRLSSPQLMYILSTIQPPLKIKKVSKFSRIEGVLLDESGTMPARGRKRASSSQIEEAGNIKSIASSTKRVVTVNPFGQECLEHISLEYMQNLLSQNLGWGVLCEFAGELYRFEKNINFSLRIKERYIKYRAGEDGQWVTSLKKSEYETTMQNLVQKNCEAVNTFRNSIPEEHLVSFEESMREFEVFRKAKVGTEERDDYEIFAKDGVNIIGENMWETVKRKKLKLV